MRKELIVHQDPKSPISEVFRTLRTNIQFMNTKGKLKTLLVTSTMPGEGKSWVSSNLAVTFAQAGKKVVLIDADMRKGRQYTIFGASPRPGLSNYLSGVGEDYDEEDDEVDLADYIQETGVENLYLIAAGNIPPNPSELLIAPQMVELLDRLKEVCDIIIIDGTPAQLVTDALILARLVDTTVVVAASNQTKREDLKRCVTNIQNVGGKIAGIVDGKCYNNSRHALFVLDVEQEPGTIVDHDDLQKKGCAAYHPNDGFKKVGKRLKARDGAGAYNKPQRYGKHQGERKAQHRVSEAF